MARELTFTMPDTAWAGTEHSFQLACEAHQAIMAAGPYNGQDNPEDPYMLDVQGNIAVIKIAGPLVNSDSPWNRYYGVSSYADIRRALVAAATNPDVKAILLDIASGGGAVSGVADTANLIRTVHEQVKPVVAFSDAGMASAAYWLGASAGKVYSSSTAIVGSIGVITTHKEYSAAFKAAGIGVTVLRAGEFKALANPNEPLTKPAIEQLTQQLQGTYSVFISHVAAMRGETVASADQKFGQGREFLGQAAADANLVDAITSFDNLMSKMEASFLDKTSFSFNNSDNSNRGNTMKKALTEQEIAALAAGMSPQALSGAATEASATSTQAEGTEAAAAAAATAATAATATAATAAPAAEVTESQKGNDPRVELLQSQLDAANENLVNARVSLQQAESRVVALEGSLKGLQSIAAASINHMRIALGSSAADLSVMGPDQLVNEHAAMTAKFTSQFKAGGVAAVPAAEAADQQTQPVPAVHLARAKATRFTPQ